MEELSAFPIPSRAYNFALMCKVCVSIFVLLSGYGVACSYIKFNCKSLFQHFKYILHRLKKLYFLF